MKNQISASARADAQKWITLQIILAERGITESDPMVLADWMVRGRGVWRMDEGNRYDAGLPHDEEVVEE